MSQPISIETEFTPNPNSIKFKLGRVLLEKGSIFFDSKEQAHKSSLAKRIFDIPEISQVFIGQDFVTVTRSPDIDSWSKIIPHVSKAIQACIESGESVVDADIDLSCETSTEIEGKIVQILEERIRPAVAQDGGNIVFHGYKDGIVTLHLQGACASCPSSTATLKAGVERILREEIPEILEVVQVRD